jgi:hypothetical protein
MLYLRLRKVPVDNSFVSRRTVFAAEDNAPFIAARMKTFYDKTVLAGK